MIGREKRVLLRHYLEQGLSKTAIARELGISRRTVYHWIKTGQLDRTVDEKAVQYGPRPRPPSILDPYKPLIRTRLAEYPKLTAKRLFQEARAAGYPGGYNVVKRYVRLVRPKTRWSASRRRLATRPRWTWPISGSPGAGATPSSSCWVIPASSGSGSLRSRT